MHATADIVLYVSVFASYYVKDNVKRVTRYAEYMQVGDALLRQAYVISCKRVNTKQVTGLE